MRDDDTDTEQSSFAPASNTPIAPESNTNNIQETDVIEKTQSVNETTFTKPRTPNRKRTRKQANLVEDPRLEKAFEFLQQPEDPSMIYAQYLANKLKQFQGRTRTLVEHAINEVIFNAEMGFYNTPAVPFTSPMQVPASTTTVVGPLSSPSCSYSPQQSPWSVTSDGHSSPPTPPVRENIPSPQDDVPSAKGNVPQDDLLSQLQTYINL